MSGVFGGWRGELCFADDELDTARHRMTAALDQLRAGGWRRDAHELLLAWSGWEADAGNGERAETLANEAHAESEVSMADGPATWVGT